jgi:hypothetical protein
MIIFILFIPTLGFSQLRLEPHRDSFYEHHFGSYLEVLTSGISNEKVYGTGCTYGHEQRVLYQAVKNSLKDNYQWVLRNLDTNTIVTKSSKPNRQFYGASVSKVFVAGAYLDSLGGQPTPDGIEHINKLIVVSSNSSWSALQVLLGSGDENLGRQRVESFLKKLDITKSIGYRGYLNGVHGNEVNAMDISKFIQSSYDERYYGSKHLFQTMFLSRTGKLRGKKYFPKNMNIGGKTGSYNGQTSVNGEAITSKSNHHTIVFKKNNHYYSLTVLSDPGTNEEVAVLSQGLVEQFLH